MSEDRNPMYFLSSRGETLKCVQRHSSRAGPRLIRWAAETRGQTWARDPGPVGGAWAGLRARTLTCLLMPLLVLPIRVVE